MDTREQKSYIMKRSGVRVPYDGEKIISAITKANHEISLLSDRLEDWQIQRIEQEISRHIAAINRDLSVEEIQDMVENAIMDLGKFNLARSYITYRFVHNQRRRDDTLDKRIIAIVDCISEEANQENSNKDPTILSVQRDYMASQWSSHYSRNYLLPNEIVKAHDEGIIHFHDTDYYGQRMHNCCLINLEDMLQNGTRISETTIETPKSFTTACTICSQIIAQVASSQYGGQTISLAHLAPFVDVSRQKIRQRLKSQFEATNIDYTEQQLNQIVETNLRYELEGGCQTLQYQLITLMTTNGQAPFVSVFMYINEVPEGQIRKDLALLIEIMLEQRIIGIKDETGVYITPAFPKLLYVLQENNIAPGTEYYYLTELSARCSAKRMVPDYISEKIMRELKGDIYACMGCRSFLTPDRFTDANIGNIAKAKNYTPGAHKYYGRFNQGVVTLNLVDIACSANGQEDLFWTIMDERLDLCHRALRLRHERLLGTRASIAPIQWIGGALARLNPEDTIDELLKHGYSTLSLGYAGLAECVHRMKACSHTDPDGKEFGLAVMQAMNDACAKWKADEDIDYSVYGTPIESTTYRFAKCLQRRFGSIPNVTDRNYITNSYHIDVKEEINAFDKLTTEAEFQKLSPGGAISYIEVPDMKDNIPAVMAILTHIYETILYAELNTKSDCCTVCGFDGEIKTVQDEGKLGWECPNCGCRDQSKMHVARRTCGYIGTQYWNQGRTQEIADRVLHVSVDD